MIKFLITYLVIVNIIAFLAYGLDKLKAKANRWRIKESVLLMFAIIGGPFGAIFGMNIFRHKTRKLKFKIINYPMLIIWLIAIVWMLWSLS